MYKNIWYQIKPNLSQGRVGKLRVCRDSRVALEWGSTAFFVTLESDIKRLKKIKKAIKAARGEVKAFFLTMDRYDAVYIIEAKNDETVAKIMLTIGAAGNVKTETLKAFKEEEFEKIIASIQ